MSVEKLHTYSLIFPQVINKMWTSFLLIISTLQSVNL